MRVPLRKTPNGTSYMHLHGDGSVVLEKEFDPTAAIEHATAMRNEVQQTGELRKVMSVPNALIHKWLREGKLGDQAFQSGALVIDKAKLEALMRDPDYALLRAVDKL